VIAQKTHLNIRHLRCRNLQLGDAQNKVVKTIGVANTKREEELLIMLAETELERIRGMQTLIVEHDDLVVENFVNGIAIDHLQIVGSELILGKIYGKIGFPDNGSCRYFRNLVLCRLVYPGRLKNRIEAHTCICFAAYTIYKELERLLRLKKNDMSAEKAIRN
jgi:hypothetical protein